MDTLNAMLQDLVYQVRRAQMPTSTGQRQQAATDLSDSPPRGPNRFLPSLAWPRAIGLRLLPDHRRLARAGGPEEAWLNRLGYGNTDPDPQRFSVLRLGLVLLSP